MSMENRLPVVMVRNKTTGKIHPAVMRIAPEPGKYKEENPFQRYSCIVMHPLGFDPKDVEKIREFCHPYFQTDVEVELDWKAQEKPSVIVELDLGEIAKRMEKKSNAA